jgi:hypothetical protein
MKDAVIQAVIHLEFFFSGAGFHFVSLPDGAHLM